MIFSSSDFNRLGIFVAVAGELRREPFLSEDNHEKLTLLSESLDSTRNVSAHFTHPAFLKSAVLPFRKLWEGSSDVCAFDKIRDLVFEKHPDRGSIEPYHPVFYDAYSRLLDEPAAKEWAEESRRKILNIWIYTQGIHAGQRENRKRQIVSSSEPTLNDFITCATRIGREKFEYLFRTSLREVGSMYVQFLEKFAAPLFWSLARTTGFAIESETSAALQFNPYPDPRYNITFDDVFWHLDKESMEETFDRLLARQSYGALHSLFQGLFATRAAALAAVCRDENLHKLLETIGAVILQENETPQGHCIGTYSGGLPGLRFEAVEVQVYAEKKLKFFRDSESACVETYGNFRECLFGERQRQQKRTWRAW
jgi:hypothetical protein